MLLEPPSHKHEFRGRYTKSHCDVTDHWGKFIFYIIVPSSFHIWSQMEAIVYTTWILKIPGNSFDFQFLQQSFKLNQTRNLSVSGKCPISDIFWQYLFPSCTIKTGKLMTISKFDLLFNTTYTTRHPHLHTCEKLFVWHRSFIVKLSEKNILKNTQKPSENIITSLS